MFSSKKSKNGRYADNESNNETPFGDENFLFYDENSKEETTRLLRTFDSDTGGLTDTYQEKILPALLQKTDFIPFLMQNHFLYSENLKCMNFRKCAQRNLELSSANDLNDKFNWKCRNCGKTRSVRLCSIFNDVNCNLRSSMRIIYGWAKGTDLDIMANMLGLDRSVVGNLYNRCAKVAEKYLNLNLSPCQIGGSRIVVIIDIYPNFIQNAKPSCRGSRPILCIAEIRNHPQRYWLKPLDFFGKTDAKNFKKTNEMILKTIEEIVLPGSILVLPSKTNSHLSFFDDVESLRNIYPTITNVEELSRHSTSERSLVSILETIWKKPLGVCEEAQFYSPIYLEQFIMWKVWSEATATNAYELLLDIIAYETKMQDIDESC